MKIKVLHRWDLTPKEAVALQRELCEQVISRDMSGPVTYVAGVDVGFEDKGKITRAAVAVLSLKGLVLVEQSVVRIPTTFPYIPGLLSFREIPALLQAFKPINTKPDLIICDGQGLAHPRSFGIACHLGLILDIPSIGVAKTRLVGSHGIVPETRGGWCALRYKGKTVGAVLRTRQGVKPVFVSSGHQISLNTAVDMVMACTTRYRLPETTRVAHRLASL